MSRRWVERAGYAFSTFVLRRCRPHLLGLAITDRCNLHCNYCRSHGDGSEEMTWDEVRDALESAYRRGHRALYLTGGEPTLWSDGPRDLSDVVDLAYRLGYHRVAAATNGTRPLSVRGCRYVVTVDGPRDIHDRIRSGTYDTVLRNAAATPRKSVLASITITRETAPRLEQAIRDLSATGIFRGVMVNFLTGPPALRARLGVSPTERARLLNELRAMQKRGLPIVLSRAAKRALSRSRWRRPIRQSELVAKDGLYVCCRDVVHPEVCEGCGYTTCCEVSQALTGHPSALLAILRSMD